MRKLKGEKSVRMRVPVYNLPLEIVATDDIMAAQNVPQRKRRMGNQRAVSCQGLVQYAGPYFCLYLQKGCIDHDLIAHEVFHLTHRILNYCGLKFDPDNHEAFSYLTGTLTNVVYSYMKEWKIRVK